MVFRVLKKSIVAIYFVLVTVCLLSFLLLIYKTNFDLSIIVIGAVIFIGPIVIILHTIFWGNFSHKVEISKQGVMYNKRKESYFMPWNKIRVVGINADRLGRFTNNCYIYFDARNDALYAIPKEFKDYNDLYFGVQYRKQIISEIKKYWDKSIINLDKLYI